MRSMDGTELAVVLRLPGGPDRSVLLCHEERAAGSAVAVGAGTHTGGRVPGRHAAARLAALVGAGSLIAVVGPPAVGKSTATAWAAIALRASVLRLREFAERYRSTHPELDHLFATVDPLGWLRDDTVKILFEEAVAGRARSRMVMLENMVLLENLPGNGAQLGYLVDIAAAHCVSLQVIELTAPDSLLTVRAGTRRVCPTCEPDTRDDPHRPAQALTNTPDRCASCGGRLVPRRSDEPRLFQARLRRFRGNQPAIRATAQALRVPYRVVDATVAAAAVGQALLAACQPTAATLL